MASILTNAGSDMPEPLPNFDENGVGFCTSDCPAHDGKRCRYLGLRAPEGNVCEPWARAIVLELNKLRGN